MAQNVPFFFDGERKVFFGADALRTVDLAAANTGAQFQVIGGDLWESNGSGWNQISTAGAAHVAEVGIASQPHRRYLSGITATWPGNDTFSMSFTSVENVRRYRVLVIGGAAGDYVKVAEDAANQAQAAAWLADPASSASTDVEHSRVYAIPTGTIAPNNYWSEWRELSKYSNDLSLSRLDFLGSAAGPFNIFVEAE